MPDPDSRGPTVVSITPVAVQRDSRTYKQAASLARFGYRSIVVEGEESELDRATLPFTLVTVAAAAPVWDSAEPAPPAQAPPSAPGRVRAALDRWRGHTYVFRWHIRRNLRAQRSLPKADLYVVHSFPLFGAVLLRSVLRRRARFIYDAHDAYFEMIPDQERSLSALDRSWRRLERVAVRRAAGFSTVSEGLAGVLAERHGRRPVAIRNCHDLRLEEKADPGVRRSLGLGDDAFLLVTVGNRKDGMDVPSALAALESLPEDVHLALVGRGYERFRAQIDSRGLGDRAHLMGPAPPAQVVDFVRSADAALLPYVPLTRNYSFGLPNGFFQSIAAGLPVVYPSALVEVRELAERYQLGLAADAAEPQSIVAAIDALRGDPPRRARLAAAASAAAEAESWEREERVLADLVDSALADPSRRSGGRPGGGEQPLPSPVARTGPPPGKG